MIKLSRCISRSEFAFSGAGQSLKSWKKLWLKDIKAGRTGFCERCGQIHDIDADMMVYRVVNKKIISLFKEMFQI